MEDLTNLANRAAFIQQSTDAAEIIHVYGDVDVEDERAFRDSILQASAYTHPIVIDLTKCTFFGSRGLHVLFELSKGRPSGSFSVAAPPQIANLFDIVGLSDLVQGPRTSAKADV